MNDMINTLLGNFHLLRPMWLLLMIPAVVMAALLLRRHLRSGHWQQHIDPELQSYMLDQAPGRQSRGGVWFIILAWLMAVFALSGPTWERRPVPVISNPDALVIMLDMSLSMGAQDVTPTRAVRAIHKATDVLRGRPDSLTAVIAYAGDAHTVVPFTDDHATVEHLLASLSPEIMPKLGSRPDKAIELAHKMMTDTELSKASLLMITDGIREQDIDRMAALLTADTPLSVIAVGTSGGAPISLGGEGFLKDSKGNIILPRLDTRPLQALYEETGSHWKMLSFDDSDWKSLLGRIDFSDASQIDDRQIERWQDAGYWLVILLIPIALLSFRRGVVFVLPLLLIMQTPKADAFEWADLWQTADQQGQALLDQDPATAAETFSSPEWRGTANYRAGQYEQAAKDFAAQEGPEARYNQGNALAQMGDYEKALEAYDQALEQQPDFPQAAQNRQLIQDLLDQQQQQQDQQQNGDQGEQNQDQQNQDQSQEGGQNQDSQDNSQESSQQNSDQNSDQNSQQGSQQENSQQDNPSPDSQDASQQEDDDYAEQQAEQQAQQQENEPPEQQASQQQSAEENLNADPDETPEQQNQSPTELSEQEAGDQPSQGMTASDALDDLSPEQRAAVETILNEVPDDPGLLMKRKFLYQYRQQGDQTEEDLLW